MAFAARWIRSAPVGPHDLHAACIGLALAQGARAAPVVFWAAVSAPVLGEPCDIEEHHFAFALIAPLRFAPGRRSRWRAWALAPALATYRHFGVHAYLDDDAICLNGRRIAACGALTIGACALVVSSFLPRPPDTLAEWAERDLEGAFRTRIEAQHGWQFENSWPSKSERLAIADALAEEAADAK
jgi:hypothetical protein